MVASWLEARLPGGEVTGYRLRRLFEWQGILQLKPKQRFFIRQYFFSLTVHCCFMAILKTSADTNA